MEQKRGAGTAFMTDLSWRVRVAAAGAVASGILVDDRQVLTCAHVVRGCSRAEVFVAGQRVGARVDPYPGWNEEGDLGDVAVLRLDRRVKTQPARFAGLDALRDGGPGLGALGFPTGYEGSGQVIALKTRPGLALYQDWMRVEVENPELGGIEPGFSGAAVYEMDTMRVVGMISDQDHHGATGRMLPLSSLRRYWPELDDHIRYEWLTPKGRYELRKLLSAIRRPPRLDVFARAFPADQPQEFHSLWDAIRYIGEEHIEDAAIAHFLRLLLPLLRPLDQHRLVTWFTKWLPDEEPPPGTRVSAASVLVRVDRLRNETTLSVEALVNNESRLQQETSVREETEDAIRAAVEKLLPEVCLPVLPLNPLIEFALPESLFGLPVETWQLDPNDGTPLSTLPVVIRDVDRLSPNSFRAGFARRRWDTLRAKNAVLPVLWHCEGIGEEEYRPYISPDDVCVVAHARQPSLGQLRTALGLGMPVMLWTRGPCPPAGHEQCIRNLKGLTRQLRGLPPDALPQRVKTLRDNAARPLRKARPRYGKELTLFWDDPARSPDPPMGMEFA
ncbi:trypsin-like peptidase domain-containing protein [Actinoallomurus iriomotensis]|uniref:Serine protease n=1 Tax=Actinoallomurus iriomotensis TaxID=478107 RepID=A0A9W6S0S2_9ACTN|nr:trypsin-like peptidase domain-containing protein [Actinoallomurus iriomotensis]GLY83320.1 serine protease [Actinoallomurus iriomotensis]